MCLWVWRICVRTTLEHNEHGTSLTRDLFWPSLQVFSHIANAQDKQKKSYESRKRRNVKSFHIHEGEEVLKANKRKEGRKGGRMEHNWTGPYLVQHITEKGAVTLADITSGTILRQKTNIAHLKPYRRREQGGNFKWNSRKIEYNNMWISVQVNVYFMSFNLLVDLSETETSPVSEASVQMNVQMEVLTPSPPQTYSAQCKSL